MALTKSEVEALKPGDLVYTITPAKITEYEVMSVWLGRVNARYVKNHEGKAYQMHMEDIHLPDAEIIKDWKFRQIMKKLKGV